MRLSLRAHGLPALIREILPYRDHASLSQDPHAGGPFIDLALTYKLLASITEVTFVAAYLTPLLLLTTIYLFCSSSRGIRAWHSRWPPQGLCRSLDTHRGPKSPARDRSCYSRARSIPMQFPGGPRVLTPPRVSVKPHILQTSPLHSGQSTPDVQPFSKKKSFLRALKRAQLHGMTWYKGKMYSASMLGTSQIEIPPPAFTQEKPTGPAPSGTKLKANRFSVSVGTLVY